MRIDSIFELLKDKLWAVQYLGDSSHAINILKDNWSDVSWLLEYFEAHRKDLQSGFYSDEQVDDAIEITLDEADELFQALENEDLNSLFKPLDDRQFQIIDFQKHKAKGSRHKSWLRIYAVRYLDGFVVTGGAIKLTHQMKDRDHTVLELAKMSMVRDALKMNEVDDKFVDLE